MKQYSDHRPMLLRGKGSLPPKHSRPFRFQAAWLTHNDFSDVVLQAWNKRDHMVPSCLNFVREDACNFNKNVFVDINRRKLGLEKKIKQIQTRLETVDSARVSLMEASLQKQYNDVLKQEEILWFQKSRENTKFFHTQIVVRRKRNKIQGLFLENNQWCTNDDILQSAVVTYFNNLFQVDPDTCPKTLSTPHMPCMSDFCKNSLTGLVLKEEVRRAVFFNEIL